MTAALDWLARPELARLWEVAHHRLERNGVTLRGSVRLGRITTDERVALELLLRRRVAAAEVSVRLADLDRALRSSAASTDLVSTLSHLGRPVVDRIGLRAESRAERDRVWAAAQEQVGRLGRRPWLQSWQPLRRCCGWWGHLDTPWDDQLRPAMEAAGVAVHEEGVLDDLLADLLTG